MSAARIAGVLFGPPDAGSFVVAGQNAFERARVNLGADVTTYWLEERESGLRIARLRAIIEAGIDLLVLHGAQGEVPAAVLASEFPGTAFSLTQGRIAAGNVASYEVLLEQPAFLAGALAGWISRSGVVGHLSGERVRAGLTGRAAFAGGLRWALPGARFLTVFCGAQHDPALASHWVKAQAAAGADVVFTMLGAGRDGAIDACRVAGARQIGDGVDWCDVYPDVFVASAVADSGWASYQAIDDFLAGRWRPGTGRTTGLEDPRICRLSMGRDVDAGLGRRIAALSRDILSGAVKVPDDWQGEEFGAGPGLQ